METYLIKANISLIATYLLYRLILRNTNNPQSNRLILVFGILCSLVLPLFHFELGSSHYSFESVGALVESKMVAPITKESWHDHHSLSIYSIVYIIGAILLALRSIAGLATLLYYYLASPTLKKWGFHVVEINSMLSPSTFFNFLFVGPGVMNSPGLGALITHERVHKTQYHSFDVLLLELLTIIMWFNPFSWLIKKEVKLSHEFIADREVLKSGIDLLDYQQLLFQTCTGGSANWVNQLSKESSLEKRFKMMNNVNINSNQNYFKILLAVPLIGLIVFLCSFHAISQPGVLPKYKQGVSAMYKKLGKAIIYPTTAKNENRQGTVYVTFSVSESGEVSGIQAGKVSENLLDEMVVVGYTNTTATKDGINEEMEKAAIHAVKSLDRFTPAKKNGKPVICELTIPMKFILQ